MRTLDHINFFYHLNKPYPVQQIIESKGSQFVSVFSDRKWYLASKVMDTDLESVNDAKLSLVRVKSALFLKVSLLVEGRKGYINNFFPLNPHKLASANLPSDDVVPTIELHYISSLQGTLVKAITLIPSDVLFTEALVNEYIDSRDTTRSADEFDRHANFFVWNGFADGEEVFTCGAVIEKQQPVDDEPELTDYRSLLDEALAMNDDELATVEAQAELMDELEE